MPAIITHRLFGEDAANRLPEGLVDSEEELLSFLLANQGTDPFLARFSTTPASAETCHRFFREAHAGKATDALIAVRDAVRHLPEGDKRMGRAFVLGLLAHHVLDGMVHPFVIAQQRAICTVDEDLLGFEREVRAIIESELDSWLLWSLRGQTVIDAPVTDSLARTDRIVRVGGALLSQMALQVFGIELRASAYGRSVSDYETVYALVDPVPSRRTAALARVEGLLRGRSYLQALAHRATTSAECPAANIERFGWRDPLTGRVRHDGFADLYFEALDMWPGCVEALVLDDAARLRGLVGPQVRP